MYCKYCGNKIDDDSLFCSKCGKPVVKEEKVESAQQEVPIQMESIVQGDASTPVQKEPEKNVEIEIHVENSTEKGGLDYKKGLLVIAIIVAIMMIVGSIANIMAPGEKLDGDDIVEIDDSIEDDQEQEKQKEEPKEEKKEEKKEEASNEEQAIVVNQPSGFNGNDFWIPSYTSSNRNEDSAMLVKSFFEMKGINFSVSTLVNELGCANHRANANTMADVLCRHINEYGIQAIYEVTYFNDANDFNANAGWVFSIVQTNVNDGYPTFFEVDPAYIYGGIPQREVRYILVKGYELGNGGIVKLLIDDPVNGAGIVVGYDSFVQAVTNKSNILYIH